MSLHATRNTTPPSSMSLCFNTVAGMSLHATASAVEFVNNGSLGFQYRCRYEPACNKTFRAFGAYTVVGFQYRCRYEPACNSMSQKPRGTRAQTVVLVNLPHFSDFCLTRVFIFPQKSAWKMPLNPVTTRLSSPVAKNGQPPPIFGSFWG